MREGATALSIEKVQGQVSSTGVVHFSWVQQPEEHERSGTGGKAEEHHEGRRAGEQRALSEEPVHEQEEWRHNVHKHQAQRQHNGEVDDLAQMHSASNEAQHRQKDEDEGPNDGLHVAPRHRVSPRAAAEGRVWPDDSLERSEKRLSLIHI